MVRYLFYTIGDLTYQSPLVCAWKSTFYQDIFFPPRLFFYLTFPKFWMLYASFTRMFTFF